MNLGDRIANLRKQQGLSQEAFAEKLGVSRQSVSKWESGVSLPDIEKLSRISEVFDVSIDHLIKGTEIADAPESADPPATPDAPAEPDPPADAEAAEDTPQEAVPTAQDEATQELTAPTNEDDGDVWSVGTLADGARRTAAKEKHRREQKQKKKKRLTRRIIALAVAVCLLAAIVGAVWGFGGIKPLWWALHGGKVQYPYVLVHGLGSWGEDDGATPYWGGTAGDLAADLRSAGYDVVAPRVGPISSTWDRACELYAQLTGTTVDYGEAHAKQHGHARFGRSYDTALVPDWGQKKNGGQLVKINLVGHSYGGTTARLLTWLLANGSDAERQATGRETSPLFTGGKGDWVHSVTTLATPHDGTSLTCALNAPAALFGIDLTKTLFDVLFKFAGVISTPDTPFDFMLDQFDIAAVSGTQAQKDAVTSFFRLGTDNAGYDLSPDGAKALGSTIGTVDSVYYFSFAYRTTQEGMLLGYEIPDKDTNPLLMPTATAIGLYTGTTPGGIEIGDAWLPNDGLVNVISALYPGGEPHKELPTDEAPKTLERGVWYVAQPIRGDHGTPIGLDGDMAALHDFWTAQFERIDALKR
ncbi:MAG: helix-turn-helix domain-containing protein [Clostridia bacterium]|nr:helix-turn-helix domain-containing protein [Clostridia bacterium]